MGRRSFMCPAAAAAAVCCCFCLLALLVGPVHARSGTGLLGGAASSGRDYHRLVSVLPEPQFHTTEQQEEEHEPRGAAAKARSSWSAAGRLRTELRAVPGGPDPLHHHGGSPRRPEQERNVP